MREVHTDVALLNAAGTMAAETARAFGDGRLYVEKLLTNAAMSRSKCSATPSATWCISARGTAKCRGATRRG